VQRKLIAILKQAPVTAEASLMRNKNQRYFCASIIQMAGFLVLKFKNGGFREKTKALVNPSLPDYRSCVFKKKHALRET
jgi:hypothetical protein